MPSVPDSVNLHIAVADQQVVIYALLRLLREMVYDQDGTIKFPTEEELERVRFLLEKGLPGIRDDLICKVCGHAMADHDERGCTYIACRNICLKDSD